MRKTPILGVVEIVLIPLLAVWWLVINLLFLPGWMHLAGTFNMHLPMAARWASLLSHLTLGVPGVVMAVLVAIFWALAAGHLSKGVPGWLIGINFMIVALLGWMVFVVHATASAVAAIWVQCGPIPGISASNPFVMYHLPDLSKMDDVQVRDDLYDKGDSLVIREGRQGAIIMTVQNLGKDDSEPVTLVASPSIEVDASESGFDYTRAEPDAVSVVPGHDNPSPDDFRIAPGHPIQFAYHIKVHKSGYYRVLIHVPVNLKTTTVPFTDSLRITPE